MSPEPTRLDQPPSAARIVNGDLDSALCRWIEARERAAFERGVEEGNAFATRAAAGALSVAAEQLAAEQDRAAELAVEVALEIARTLLRRNVREGNYDIVKIVRESLAAANSGRGRCVVHVNPLDAAALEGAPFRAGTTIEPDSAVTRGNAQISTPRGLVVSEFEQALDAIGEELREELA